MRELCAQEADQVSGAGATVTVGVSNVRGPFIMIGVSGTFGGGSSRGSGDEPAFTATARR